ncbi:hypothetical protein PU634_16625 [Oceanimonas pelagia]|uniref:Uncharacterized protein n=1 Tax=Oceanimonas pelagia TaxID=3028314 RepID=A0AA50KP57_9GAMM|nr:hypothetical protein [Oceanimonas pelagia]WMC10671.1 hypothetical protein PU634_16625 [Oceanimonas pelagia]
MKPNHFNFDRTLYDILQQQHLREFTIRELRNEYAARLDGCPFSLVQIRKYIYSQVRRMLRIGWVKYDTVRLNRNQVYHLLNFPETTNLVLISSPIFNTSTTDSRNIKIKDGVHNKSEEEKYLKSILDDLTSKIAFSIGELECYKGLIKTLPQMKKRIESEYIKSTDEKNRLLGHIKAINKLLEKNH